MLLTDQPLIAGRSPNCIALCSLSMTPLLYAVAYNQTNYVEELLQKGSVITHQDKRGAFLSLATTTLCYCKGTRALQQFRISTISVSQPNNPQTRHSTMPGAFRSFSKELFTPLFELVHMKGGLNPHPRLNRTPRQNQFRLAKFRLQKPLASRQCNPKLGSNETVVRGSLLSD